MVNNRVWNAVVGCNLKNDRMISVRFQGKPFNITVIQVYAPTSNTEEAEVERFYEDLQYLLELTSKKDVFFIIGDWNAKVGSQELPGVEFEESAYQDWLVMSAPDLLEEGVCYDQCIFLAKLY